MAMVWGLIPRGNVFWTGNFFKSFVAAGSDEKYPETVKTSVLAVGDNFYGTRDGREVRRRVGWNNLKLYAILKLYILFRQT